MNMNNYVHHHITRILDRFYMLVTKTSNNMIIEPTSPLVSIGVSVTRKMVSRGTITDIHDMLVFGFDDYIETDIELDHPTAKIKLFRERGYYDHERVDFILRCKIDDMNFVIRLAEMSREEACSYAPPFVRYINTFLKELKELVLYDREINQ